MDYRVSFKVHLLPDRVPEGWSNPVLHDLYIRAPDINSLRNRVDTEALTFIKQQGVVVLKNSTKPYQNDIATMDLRAFVTFNMIAYITHETQLIIGDISDEAGLVEGEKAS